MRKEKKLLKKVVGTVLVSSLVLSSAVVDGTSSEAAVSKKVITVTVNKSTPVKRYFLKTMSRNWKKCQTDISIRVTKISGKAKKKVNLIPEQDDGGCGCIIEDLKASKFKKGYTAKMTLCGWASVDFDMPDGVKSVTYQVTFYNKKRMITSVTKKDLEWYLPENN